MARGFQKWTNEPLETYCNLKNTQKLEAEASRALSKILNDS